MWLKGDNKISTLFRGRRRLENIQIFYKRKYGKSEVKRKIIHLFYKRIWLKIKQLFIHLRGGDLKIKEIFRQSQRRKRLKGKKKRLFITKKRKMGGNIYVKYLEIKYSKKQIVHPPKWKKRLANLEVSL
jgi:hypothetical protein